MASAIAAGGADDDDERRRVEVEPARAVAGDCLMVARPWDEGPCAPNPCSSVWR